MKRKLVQGFAMLEVLLAVIVIAMASYGVVSMFKSGGDQADMTQLENQLMQIAYAYSDLAASGLTSSTSSSSDLISLLENSRKIPTNYFSTVNGSDAIVNSYGSLSFSSVSSYSFEVSIPFGDDKTIEQAAAVYAAVKNNYSCVSGCSTDESNWDGTITLELDLTD